MLSLSSTSEALQVFALQFGFKLWHEKVQNRSLKKPVYQAAGSRGRPGQPAPGNAVTACGQAAGRASLTLPVQEQQNIAPRHTCTQTPPVLLQAYFLHRERGFSLLLKDSLNRNVHKKTFSSVHAVMDLSI